MNELLNVTDLSKRFGPDGDAVVDRMSFDVGNNEIFVLLGPSGCGKTTALRLIAGFERPDAGSIELAGQIMSQNGTHIPPHRRRIGFVFQDYALFPHMTVMQNVCYGLAGQSRHHRHRRAAAVLKMTGMTPLAHRMPQELSGGEQQRVALARSIAPAPTLILLDEPFSNLDASMRQTMRHDVRRLLRRNRMSAVLVTHDQEEALSFADRLGVMHNGRIEQIGRPDDVYHRPRTAFVAQFLGRTNLLAADAQGCCAQCALGLVRLDNETAGDIRISIRPEHLRFENLYPGKPAGQIIRREFKGHDLTYTVVLGDHTLLVQTDYSCPFVVGQSVRVVPTEPAVVVESDHGAP